MASAVSIRASLWPGVVLRHAGCAFGVAAAVRLQARNPVTLPRRPKVRQGADAKEAKKDGRVLFPSFVGWGTSK